MTLDNLRKILAKKLSLRLQDNELKPRDIRQGYVNGLPETHYQRRLRLTPEQRYQDMKRQSHEHKENRYSKYSKIYREFYKVPLDMNYLKAYNVATAEAESRFNERYPEGGCTPVRCIPSCRFYEPTGKIDDKELAELNHYVV